MPFSINNKSKLWTFKDKNVLACHHNICAFSKTNSKLPIANTLEVHLTFPYIIFTIHDELIND